MGGYEIFLAVFQVFVIGSMFFVLKRYGKKGLLKYVGVLLLIVVGIVGLPQVFKDSNKPKSYEEKSFEERYAYYVQDEQKKICQDKSISCKEYMLANRLGEINKPNEALKYFVSAYEKGIAKELDNKAYILDQIATIYFEQKEYKEAEKYTKLSIEDGLESNICFLGMIYRDMKQYKDAYELFDRGYKKGYIDCTLDLGTFYYNGTFVKKDIQKASKLWKEAYKDDKYGTEINFNMALLNEKEDSYMYKYHLTIAALAGDSDAQNRLKLKQGDMRSYLLSMVNTSEKFVNDAICTKCYNYDSKKKFAYGTELYQRFQKIFNKENLWKSKYLEDGNPFVYLDKYATITFTKDFIKVEQILEKDHFSYDFKEAVILANQTLFVDMPKDISENLQKLTEKISLSRGYHNKDYKESKKISTKNHTFIWDFNYIHSTKKAVFEMRIEE